METVRFERVDPRENALRYYQLTIEAPDLFGAHTLLFQWGRIGEPPVMRRESYPDAAAARGAFQVECRERLRRGYRLVEDPTGLLSDDPAFAGPTRHRLLHAADELERLTRHATGGAGGIMASLAAQLGSALRQRASLPPTPTPLAQPSFDWPLEALDACARARCLELIALLADGLLGPGHGLGPAAAPPSMAAATHTRRMVPLTLHHVLDRPLLNAFADWPALDGLARRLHRRDIRYLGQLVQMCPEELRRETNGNRHVLDVLDARLAAWGLSLACDAPRWVPPDRRARKAG